MPESVTRSLRLRRLAPNWARRVVKLALADGKLLPTSDANETFPSFLPVKTGHISLRNYNFDRGWNCQIPLKTLNLYIGKHNHSHDTQVQLHIYILKYSIMKSVICKKLKL